MDHIAIAKDALVAQAEAVKTLSDRIGGEFQSAVELILNCSGRAVISGVGKSGIIAMKLAATLASTGTPSFFLHPCEAFHGDLGMIMPGDLSILISYRGETEEVLKLIPSLKEFNNRIIALTGDLRSTIAKHADVVLDISVEREVCPNNLAPTTSTLATMAMGDALAVALIKARNFQARDFARFHPGGTLGKRLLARVRDVMHTSLPIVSPNTTIHDCLFTMTSGRMGLAIIMDEDRLVGLITDGDLRRSLLKDPKMVEKFAGDFMTPDPLTIDADMLLTEAETFMHNRKVRALVVTEGTERHVCGVIEIFD